jgi:hypothetical protein
MKLNLNSDFVASAGWEDKTVRLTDLTTLEHICDIKVQCQHIRDSCFSEKGGYLLCQSDGRQHIMQHVDQDTRVSEVFRFADDDDQALHIAYNKQNRTLIVGTLRGLFDVILN